MNAQKILVHRLEGVPCSDRSAVYDLLPEMREHRANAFEGIRVAADHDRELAAFGADNAATHWGVEKLYVPRRELRRDASGRRRVAGRAVHEDRAPAHALQQSARSGNQRFDILRCGEAGDDDVAAVGGSGGRGGVLHSRVFGRKARGPLGGSIPDGEIFCTGQVMRHGAPDGAKSEKGNASHGGKNTVVARAATANALACPSGSAPEGLRANNRLATLLAMTDADARVTTTTLTIGGMSAVHAVRAVFTALSGVPGVINAEVGMGRAVVEHDGRAGSEPLRAAIELAGCELLTVEDSRRRLPLL